MNRVPARHAPLPSKLPSIQARSASKGIRLVTPHGAAPPGRQKSRRYGFFSFHDLRQPIPQKVEKS